MGISECDPEKPGPGPGAVDSSVGEPPRAASFCGFPPRSPIPPAARGAARGRGPIPGLDPQRPARPALGAPPPGQPGLGLESRREWRGHPDGGHPRTRIVLAGGT